MTLTYSPAVNRNADGVTGSEPRDLRVALEGMLIREGLLPGSPATLVQGTGGWAYQVNGPAWWATRRASGDGLHVWGNDGAITVGESVSGEDAQGGTVPSAPASGLERIDIIWVMQGSNGESGDTSSVPRAGVAVGEAGGVAIAPSIPAGATEIARNTMTSAATSTSSAGNSIAPRLGFTATKGGSVHCRTQAELDAVKALASPSNAILAELAGALYVCADGSTATPVLAGDTGWTAPVSWGAGYTAQTYSTLRSRVVGGRLLELKGLIRPDSGGAITPPAATPQGVTVATLVAAHCPAETRRHGAVGWVSGANPVYQADAVVEVSAAGVVQVFVPANKTGVYVDIVIPKD